MKWLKAYLKTNLCRRKKKYKIYRIPQTHSPDDPVPKSKFETSLGDEFFQLPDAKSSYPVN